MRALTKIAAGGVAAAALFSAAPAAAQYYPGYGGGYGNVVGQVINQVLGGGGYGVNHRAVVAQCVGAVQQRLHASYGYGASYGGYGGAYGGYGGGYGGYPAYGGYNGYPTGGPRVLGISRVEQRSGGGLTVRGVANSGRVTAYGYGYGNNNVDLTFKCRTDFRGFITDIDIDRAQTNYGYNPNSGYNYNNGYANTYDPNDPYAAYGYRRY